MNNKNTSKMRENLIKYWSDKILYSVSTKKHIYKTLKEMMSFAEFQIKPVNDELDEVTMIFPDMGEVTFKFMWKDRTNPKDPSFRRFHLYDIK